MSRGVRVSLLLVCGLGLVLLFSGADAVATTTSRPFQTGFLDDPLFEGQTSAPAWLGFARAEEAGATIERLRLHWRSVAPTRPADPTNPNDPAYNWSSFDSEVAQAVAANQKPVADILDAPSWAMSDGSTYPTTYPDPTQFADFAYAAAQHYASGSNRVVYWELFNEPNIGLYLEPQFVNGQPESAIWYRDLLNKATPLIKLANATNVVVAGSTAPYYDQTASTTRVNPAWGPLGFMRAVLCLNSNLTRDTSRPDCTTSPTVAFDEWSHHAYTEGGPTHQAVLADDVAIGDLPKMKQVLDAAWTQGLITSTNPDGPGIWITEFGWDVNPPVSGGVPLHLLERWVPEAMYQMWSDGVSVLTWYLLVDSVSPYQTGFYAGAGDLLTPAQPKSAALLEGFRFPFVAYQSAGGIRFWGRTPAGVANLTVHIEQSDGNGGWADLGQATSDQYGIFQGRFSTSSLLPVRAQIDAGASTDAGETGTPFSLRLVPDSYYPSFGQLHLEPSRTYAPRPAIQSPGAYGTRPPIPAWTP